MAITIPTPKDRVFIFNKQVNQETIGELSRQILDINQDDKQIKYLVDNSGFKYEPQPIKVYIDSYGGTVYQCFGLLGIINKSKTPIHTIVTGCAMSAGFMISISGHKKFAYDKATFMYHQLGLCTGGKLKEIAEDIVEAKRLQEMIETHVLSHTRITAEQLKKFYKRKTDKFFTCKEAVKHGIVDEVI
jgi:ATP-dependent Clp protease protease subunit